MRFAKAARVLVSAASGALGVASVVSKSIVEVWREGEKGGEEGS